MYALSVLNGTAINVTIEDKGIDWVAIAIAVATGVLAIITYFYMRETRLLRLEAEKIRIETEKMRIDAQRPIFALEPTGYISSFIEAQPSEFTRINLVNHGQPATEIIARMQWLDSEIGGGSSRDFYIVSLAKDGYAGLDIPVTDIVSQRSFMRVEIKCKDAAG